MSTPRSPSLLRKKYNYFASYFLLVTLLMSQLCFGGIRKVEVSSFIVPSSVEARNNFVPIHARFACGVVPRGSAVFLSPSKVRLSANQIGLVILDKTKLKNDQMDLDVIGIQWNSENYELSVPDKLIYPLLKFIQREAYIAYTIPQLGIDTSYFQENLLIKEDSEYAYDSSQGYVAREFNSPELIDFLRSVDISTDADDSLPSELKQSILKDVNKNPSWDALDIEQYGSYVNADFHINYQVFLDNNGSKKTADVGGLPLRYHYDLRGNNILVIDEITMFNYPEEEFDLQYKAILFFQAAAILRQFYRDNRQEFNRFFKEIEGAVNL